MIEDIGLPIDRSEKGADEAARWLPDAALRSHDHGRLEDRPPFGRPLSVMTERNHRRLPRPSALLLAAVVVVAMSPAARATSTGVTVKTHGACSGPSHWILRIHAATGARLLVTFTVTGGAAGQRWNIFMSDKGVGIFAGSRTTNSDGTFVVSHYVKDLLGLDKINTAANNTDTGETCQARGSI
jgi:hypothetical protein